VIRRANYATPLYPQKLALTSATTGGRSVGIVRSRTQATEFLVFIPCKYFFLTLSLAIRITQILLANLLT
jgi:hypothetical protein